MQPQLNQGAGPALPKRAGRGLLLVLALLIFAVSAADLRPDTIAVSAKEQAVGIPDSICFMTFNIRHAKGLDGKVQLAAIRSQIEQGKADLIALQEVDRFQWRSGMQDQARSLARSLGLAYAFAPAMRRGVSQYGIALLSRYPLSHVRTYPLPGDKEPRVVLTAEMKVRGAGQPGSGRPEESVTIVTTHLGVSGSDRARQMPQLLRVLQSIRTPIILMGDLNMPDNDPLMKELNRRLHKVSLNRPQSTVMHGGEIDHIFTSFADSCDGFAWTEPTQASDHIPVLHQISFSRLLD
ncbi:endonuclease/exonuclease/phosphatase family protein [Paenibacillus doosanensis]|uniref:endonuclease/exonuclease/phosphatase family protein n=1 Tax=Paenibacillus doosanensis TaxID=1229154 RepID=UPI00217F6E4B|nr:endonuclease/exonuclease/phosphatase family protein [Paenibacillus doosanensis]MCS7464269.1 endonuclease/exonuclease/phosphatase family protein [Paenibacillus doosanensis]